MTTHSRTIIVIVYLVASAVGIAYGQTLVEEVEAFGKLFMLGVAILGVLFGAAAAWVGLGYRVTSTEKQLGDVCETLIEHQRQIDELRGDITTDLRDIKRMLTGGQ